MSQRHRIIERLIMQGDLPIEQADAAFTHLKIYPSKTSWLNFFDKALLIIGAVALVLSLVFFIAYNWQYLGKLGKFALVEGALVLTIALYVALSFRRKYKLIRQLLLLIASVITGSLLALFGQVYQTGADTWQLFFGWALLIIPWVVIARFPALWLLWLGLINALTLLYIDSTFWLGLDYYYQDFWQFTLITLINFGAFYLWLTCFEHKRASEPLKFNTFDPAANHAPAPNTLSTTNTTSSRLHWSTYVVALLSTYTLTHLMIGAIFGSGDNLLLMIAGFLWLGGCVFMYWRFYRRHIDLLMLTYLSGSIIAVISFGLGKKLLHNFDAGGFLLLGLILIGMSSYAVVWLRKVARITHENNVPRALVKGSNYE